MRTLLIRRIWIGCWGSHNLQASRTIELAMMYLSRFDFSTVSGDILSGIYDRFPR